MKAGFGIWPWVCRVGLNFINFKSVSIRLIDNLCKLRGCVS
jgi:hypothetical protein